MAQPVGSQMAILQDIDKCTKCRGCLVACERNWPRHQNAPAGMLVASGTADTISVDDPTTAKAQRTGDRAPFVKYNCWHCPSPPCERACLATGRGAITKQADGGVHVEQHQDPTNPWDRQFCDPTDPKCHDLAGRLVCVTACQRGTYPRRGLGDGVNDKIYKCTMCSKNAQGNEGKVPGNAGKWIGGTEDGSYKILTLGVGINYGNQDIPACVMACSAGSLYYGPRKYADAYARRIDNSVKLASDGVSGWIQRGTELYPYKAGHSPYPDDHRSAGGYIWVSRDIFGHPTGDPYVEDHAVPMLDMLFNSPAGKMLLIPTLAAGGLYALYERKRMRAKATI